MPRMTESPRGTVGVLQIGNNFKHDAHHFLDHHLCYAHASADDEILRTKIHHDEGNHTPVIAVDGSGRIQKRYSVFEGEAASWPDLRFESGGYTDPDPRGY